MSPRTLLEAALQYHEFDWPSIPVNANKEPLGRWGYLRSRKQTIGEVRDRFSRPAHGLALLTWPASDLVVLDFDGPHAEAVWERQTGISLPRTVKTRTRSGWSHYVFRMPSNTPRHTEAKRKIRLVVDLTCGCEKACGVDLLINGYFVAPPTPGYTEDPDSSPLEPGGLALLPLEVLELIGSTNGAEPRAASQREKTDYSELLRGVKGGVEHDSSLKLIGHLIPKLGEAETWAIIEAWCDRCTPPADKRKVRANFKDILRREAAKGNCSEAVPVVDCLADVKAEPVEWLWPGRIPKGKLSLFIGDPEKGKSFLTLDMAARVTKGADWPDGTQAPLGDVVLLTAEDGLADTVRPRLDTMGGDPGRVKVIRAIRDQEGERVFDLTRDIPHLEATITACRAELVVIDPASAYMGAAETFRDASVRRVLAPLAALAERTGVAIVAIMHLTKDAERAAIYRTQGNVAFVAAARAVFAVAVDREDHNRRLVVPVKLNIATKPPALAFRIEAVGHCAKLVWESKPVDVDIETVLMPENPGDRTERQEAVEFLKAVLAGGPLSSGVVYERAEAEGISRRTLSRAKKILGVQVDKTTFTGGWEWRLPTEDDSPKGATPPTPKSATSPRDEELAFFAKTQQLSGLNDKVSPKSATSGTLENRGTLGEVGDALEEVPV